MFLNYIQSIIIKHSLMIITKVLNLTLFGVQNHLPVKCKILHIITPNCVKIAQFINNLCCFLKRIMQLTRFLRFSKNINFVLNLTVTKFMASNEYDSCTILMLPEPENSLEQRDISLSLASLERKQKKNENDETAVGLEWPGWMR